MHRIHFKPEEIEMGFLKMIESHLEITFLNVHRVGGKNKSPVTTEVRTNGATLANTVEDLLLNMRRDYKIKTHKLLQQETLKNVNNSRTTVAP